MYLTHVALTIEITSLPDAKVLAKVSQGLGEAMVGINCKFDTKIERYAERSE